MNITWLGHSGFRIEIGNQILLVDPWLTGNPMFEGHDRTEAIGGATHILLSHGHGDHSGDALGIARELGIPIAGMFELMEWWEESEKVETIGFSKGGTITVGDVSVTMVNAVHSSSIPKHGTPVYTGGEAGFMIAGEGHTIYFTGDTDVMADMALFQDLHAPDIGILCVGGHYTMDQHRAAYAAKKFFDFKTIIPCHYRTFPLLAQDVEVLKQELPDHTIIEPQVLVPIAI